MALLAARLEARAAENPDDVEARLVLAQVYERGGDFAKATAAYREAIALVGKLGPVPGPLHAALGETLVAADDGRVGREARLDRKITLLNSIPSCASRMPSSSCTKNFLFSFLSYSFFL